MKVLIVGLGSIARKHISALRKVAPETEILALRSSRNCSDVEGVRNVYSIEEVDSAPDFAIISNPTSCHADAICRLKELKCPLFIEKPVFESLGYDNLVDNVRESGVLTYVACNLRFLDSLKFLKEYLTTHSEVRVNEVNVYCGSYLPEWRPGTDYRRCYSSIPELGGGVHIDLIHEIDYVTWLFGWPGEVRSLLRSASSLDIRAIDYANYSLVYSGFVAQIVLNYYRRDYRRTLELVMSDETWTVDLKRNVITRACGEIVYQGEGDFQTTYEDQMRYFLSLLRGERCSDNDIHTAYNVLKICMCYE